MPSPGTHPGRRIGIPVVRLRVDERACRRLQGLAAASLLKGTHDGSAHEGRALARAGQPVHLLCREDLARSYRRCLAGLGIESEWSDDSARTALAALARAAGLTS